MNCDQKNYFFTNSNKIKQIQENYILDLVCREEKRIHFRVNDYNLQHKGKSIGFSDKVLEMAENSLSLNNKNKIFVIKISMKDNPKEYKIYLVCIKTINILLIIPLKKRIIKIICFKTL